MSRSKSSNRWLQEHFSDNYVKDSKQSGYRSRAAYKLLALDEKDQLLKPGMSVIDLGSAPGGWTQVLSEKLGGKATIIASDILPMDHFAGVTFIQGDFTEDTVYEQLLSAIGNEPVDLVLSDMAPNMSGNKVTDQARSIYLLELALGLSQQVLRPGGSIAFKIFQGAGYPEFMAQVKACFAQVKVRKPDASRARSAEVYLVAKDFKTQ